MNQINDDHQGRLSIGKVAQATGVSKSTLRHWEREFREFLETAKADDGPDRFNPNAIEKIDAIRTLVEEQGLTLRGVRLQLEKLRGGTDEGKASDPDNPLELKAKALADRVTDRLLTKIFKE